MARVKWAVNIDERVFVEDIYICLDKGLADPVGGAGDERPVAQLLNLKVIRKFF